MLIASALFSFQVIEDLLIRLEPWTVLGLIKSDCFELLECGLYEWSFVNGGVVHQENYLAVCVAWFVTNCFKCFIDKLVEQCGVYCSAEYLHPNYIRHCDCTNHAYRVNICRLVFNRNIIALL